MNKMGNIYTLAVRIPDEFEEVIGRIDYENLEVMVMKGYFRLVYQWSLDIHRENPQYSKPLDYVKPELMQGGMITSEQLLVIPPWTLKIKDTEEIHK